MPPGRHADLVWQAEPVKVVFDAQLWLWDARRTQSWTFVSLPASQSEKIRDLAGGLRRGFGSVRVRATIGGSTWTTSIFPASQGEYVLPVKRPVRVAEGLDVGDVAAVTVELIDFTDLAEASRRRAGSPGTGQAAEEPKCFDRRLGDGSRFTGGDVQRHACDHGCDVGRRIARPASR